jgi:hypothetical protein
MARKLSNYLLATKNGKCWNLPKRKERCTAVLNHTLIESHQSYDSYAFVEGRAQAVFNKFLAAGTVLK